MHSSKFGVYQLHSITSVCWTLFYVCPSIHSKIRNLPHNQQASAHIISWRYTWEGYRRLSVECIPPSLVSISSSPSLLSAKLCSMCVHRSIQDLETYRIISRPVPLSESGGILDRAAVGCTSNQHFQASLKFISSAPSSLSAKLCSMCVHRSVQGLEISSIFSWPVPVSEAGGIFGRGVVGCLSNAHR